MPRESFLGYSRFHVIQEYVSIFFYWDAAMMSMQSNVYGMRLSEPAVAIVSALESDKHFKN